MKRWIILGALVAVLVVCFGYLAWLVYQNFSWRQGMWGGFATRAVWHGGGARPPGLAIARPRRAMLVFPLVEAGNKEGKLGWDRGLVAMQAMWRSSFAPGRLLDTWDFWMPTLYAHQQLIGPGRTVNEHKIESICATFDCWNYTTGTLALAGETYTAELAFYGEGGRQNKTYTGPRNELHLLPCRIAQDVVAYLKVPVTDAQRAALAEPPLSSTQLLDEVADRYPTCFNGTLERWRDAYWRDLAAREHTQWAQDTYLYDTTKPGGDWSADIVQQLPAPHDITAQYVEGVSYFDQARSRRAGELQETNNPGPLEPGDSDYLYREAAERLQTLAVADPYNPMAVRFLARALGGLGDERGASDALARYDVMYGQSPMAPMHQGFVMLLRGFDPPALPATGKGPRPRWLIDTGRLRESRRLLEWVATSDPRIWPASRELVQLCYGLSMGYDEAQSWLDRATEVCPTDRWAYEYMLTHLANGDRVPELTLQFARRCAKTGLYDASIPTLLDEGLLYIARGGPHGKKTNEDVRRYMLDSGAQGEDEAMLIESVRRNPYDYGAVTRYLLLAYWLQDRELAKDLLDRLREGKDQNQSDDHRDTWVLPNALYDEIHDWLAAAPSPLRDAARGGWMKELQGAIATGADVNQKFEGGATALQAAAAFGHTEAVALLLKSGAAVNAADATGRTALSLAAEHQQNDVVVALFAAGADIKAPDGSPAVTLHMAALTGNTKLTELLLQHGAALDARQEIGRTPLWLAARGGHADIVRFLAGKGADINAVDKWDLTPLHIAAMDGDYGVAKALLDLGANPTALNNDKLTPADLAERKGHPELAQFLREAAAKPRPQPAAGG